MNMLGEKGQVGKFSTESKTVSPTGPGRKPQAVCPACPFSHMEALPHSSSPFPSPAGPPQSGSGGQPSQSHCNLSCHQHLSLQGKSRGWKPGRSRRRPVLTGNIAPHFLWWMCLQTPPARCTEPCPPQPSLSRAEPHHPFQTMKCQFWPGNPIGIFLVLLSSFAFLLGRIPYSLGSAKT